jgi:hypothetical protein
VGCRRLGTRPYRLRRPIAGPDWPTITDHTAVVYIVGAECEDGAIDPPGIHVHGFFGEEFNSDQARELASALLEAAAEVDRWTETTQPGEDLSPAERRDIRRRDRQPAAAVCVAVFVGLSAGYTLVGVVLAYPWFFVPLLIVAAAVWIDRRNRRRAAIVAWADLEHHALMRQFLPAPAKMRGNQLVGADNLAAQRYMVEQHGKVAKRMLRPGADHWSPTEPIPTRS